MRGGFKVIDLTQATLGSQKEALDAIRAITKDVLARQTPLLGLDVGTKHVGVARSDPGATIAFPLFGYRRISLRADARRLSVHAAHAARVEQQRAVRAVVVGVPVSPPHLCGATRRAMRHLCIAYGLAVVSACRIPCCVLWDEAFSTVLAREGLRQFAAPSLWTHPQKEKRALDSVRRPIHPPTLTTSHSKKTNKNRPPTLLTHFLSLLPLYHTVLTVRGSHHSARCAGRHERNPAMKKKEKLNFTRPPPACQSQYCAEYRSVTWPENPTLVARAQAHRLYGFPAARQTSARARAAYPRW